MALRTTTSPMATRRGSRRAATCTTAALLGLLGAAICSWSAPAAATPTLELGLFAGYGVLSPDNELGNALYSDNVPGSSALLGLRVGVGLTAIVSAEAEADLMPARYRRGDQSATILGWRLNALAQLPLMQGRLLPFALLGFGGASLLEGKSGGDSGDLAEADTDAVLQLGLGAKFRLSEFIGLRLDLRYLDLASRSDGGTTWGLQALLGASIALGSSPLDEDGDTIPDGNDKCPSEPEDRDGHRDDDGCPDRDNDGDGIPDGSDKCPNEAEDLDGFQDADGCPDRDNDRDGIPDATDKCPDGAEDRDGYEDADGCPDPDNDGDGVSDAQDKCANQAETLNGWQDKDGCPDEVPAKVRESFHGKLDGIFFNKDSAVILPSSYPVLSKALEVLKANPDLKIEISGHTDTSGHYETNVELSTQRALAVKQWFVEGGVDAGRMVARGYGPDRPLVDNETADHRAMNRRIEIHLMRPDGSVERPASAAAGAGGSTR